jgi:hypothetical protein
VLDRKDTIFLKKIEELTEEAENAAGQRNRKRLYEITRTLPGKNHNPSNPVQDKYRNTILVKEDQTARWAEHFKEHSTDQTHPSN